MSAPAIRFDGLTKYHGQVIGVEDLSLDVEVGEVFGFLGANGAGKTTTIRLMLDLLRPTRGTAAVLGYDCRRNALEARRRVGYLPGDMPVYPELTGAQYLAFLARLATRPAPLRLEQLLRRFNVSDLDLRRRMRDYSQGMKRKLGVIQALMTQAPVLILDEPTSGLDPLMIGWLIVYLLSITWCFGAVALAVAATVRRRAAGVLPVEVGAVALYLLEGLGDAWSPAEAVAPLSPFHYFPGAALLDGRVDVTVDLSVLGAATAMAIAVAYWQFARRDV